MRTSNRLIAGFIRFFQGRKQVPEEAHFRGDGHGPMGHYRNSSVWQRELAGAQAEFQALAEAVVRSDSKAARKAFAAMHSLLHSVRLDDLGAEALAKWQAAEGKLMDILHPLAAFKDARELKPWLPAMERAMHSLASSVEGQTGPGEVEAFAQRHAGPAHGGCCGLGEA